VKINKLPTGVPGLDQVLGGGLPQYSFNLLAGAPGSGKTTLAHQIAFANASADCRVLYFTVLGEPPLKMLRYMQQMGFFDPAKVDDVIRFVNLSQVVLENDLNTVLQHIVREVQEFLPSMVMVDSFRTVVRAISQAETAEMTMQIFVQRLALYLSGWQATTFLIGEYLPNEIQDNPVFTVADGILWLYQSVERNSIVRKLQVMKIRGQEPMPGLHTFRITSNGLQVFPRVPARAMEEKTARFSRRISTGIKGLDEMLGGGIMAGDAVLVAGPSGSGKTVFATQFIAAGANNSEPGVIVVFEEHPEEYIARAKSLGLGLDRLIAEGKLKVIYLRPLDLSVDETLQEIRDSVREVGAKRVVIDSLSGFELALAPTFREDFREQLYRLVGALTGTGITVLMTVEVTESYSDLRFTPHAVSFLADDIILQRYIEIEGQLRKVLTVVKMRGSGHSRDLRAYEITARGLEMGESLSQYRGIITGVPELRKEASLTFPGLTDAELMVLQALIDSREGTLEAQAAATGQPHTKLSEALSRLLHLRYVIKVTEEGKTVYRPVAYFLRG
jgi:circadian clock protein KaiC